MREKIWASDGASDETAELCLELFPDRVRIEVQIAAGDLDSGQRPLQRLPIGLTRKDDDHRRRGRPEPPHPILTTNRGMSIHNWTVSPQMRTDHSTASR
jgi:hypothetical protein